MRASLLANGLDADMPLAIALDVVEVLVQTGRAIPADKWVDDLVQKQQKANTDKMLRSLV